MTEVERPGDSASSFCTERAERRQVQKRAETNMKEGPPGVAEVTACSSESAQAGSGPVMTAQRPALPQKTTDKT